jgi:prepilin-type processing-associated H-X9-DG protein
VRRPRPTLVERATGYDDLYNGKLDGPVDQSEQPPGDSGVESGHQDPGLAPGNPNPPCAINCTNAREVYGFHSGGANTVFADGSVHFLKATVDLRLLRALVTIKSGESITADY